MITLILINIYMWLAKKEKVSAKWLYLVVIEIWIELAIMTILLPVILDL